MEKFLQLKILFYFILVLMGLQSCAEFSSDTDQNLNQSSTIIQITSPQNSNSISIGKNVLTYNIAQPYVLKFLELYIDNAFVKNIPPNTDGTLPLISFNIDSAFIGKYISLYLIYYDLNGTSQKSNTITNLLITADNRIPFKPYNIVLLNFNNSSVNVSWKDSSNNISKYEFWRKIGLSGQFSLHQELSALSFNTNDYGLDPSEIYFYKIRGVKSLGVSDFSNEVNTSGISTSGNLYPPTNLTAVIEASNSIVLNWLDNSENENYFSVERSSDNVNFKGIAFLNRNVITYKDSGSGFQTGQSYQYRIKSYSNTDSAVSNTVSIIYGSSVLIPPKSLTANYNSNIGVIQLDWINDDNNILYIDIERKTESSNFTLQRRIDSSNDFYLDFNIIGSQIYTYRIRGYDLNSYSDFSNEVTISTF
ncbi:MAG: fibronectin type III domain-containing protein [Ignavibacteriaceae bacterium]